MTRAEIKEWIQKVNSKFGRITDKATLQWADLVARVANIKSAPGWYVAWSVQPDAWGDKTMMIISAFSESVPAFYAMQNYIQREARRQGCKYIAQGSELDERYNKWLIKTCYQPFIFRKEV